MKFFPAKIPRMFHVKHFSSTLERPALFSMTVERPALALLGSDGKAANVSRETFSRIATNPSNASAGFSNAIEKSAGFSSAGEIHKTQNFDRVKSFTGTGARC